MKKIQYAFYHILLLIVIISCQPEDPEPNPPTNGTVTDIDGNIYSTQIIGTQEWMVENLKSSKYCNGDTIPNVTDNNEWQNLTTGAWAHYNNDSQYEDIYGKLYNWQAIDDNRNVCPCGWHVPSEEEWTILENYLNGQGIAGGKMKSVGTQYWAIPNTDATNESGFSGLPGGNRSTNGTFIGVGTQGRWWGILESGNNYTWYRRLNYLDGGLGKYNANLNDGLSVRCIKD
ncbi:MAG: hypothetical protein RLZ33_190 [Bacteroidota bacterium]|jgi:uncharacterized protein (TIGR02145 family)